MKTLGQEIARRGVRGSRTVDRDYFAYGGGLDLVRPPLSQPPGMVLGSKNYEPGVYGGYSRFRGFERFDGRSPKPSAATYWILDYDAAGTVAAVDDEIEGGTSGATGVVLAVEEATATTGYYVLGRVTGTFQDNEALEVGGNNRGTANGVAELSGASTDALGEEYRQLAEADARAQIQAVPGSGRIRGVHIYAGTLYAFRDNAGGTACVMHKATAAGWVEVTLNHRLRFDAGTTAFNEGDAITGATSGATATVERVVLKSGAWGTGNAVGYLILSSVTGTFQNNENIQVSSVTRAVADGANAAQTLTAGGRYEFRNWNFLAGSGTLRMYGVNGVGNAFEYDDAGVFTLIETGMTTDTPNHLAIWKEQLWLSFPGGSLQNSGIGRPLSWTVVTGANEFGIGDECTGLVEEVEALVVFARDRTKVMYGNNRSDFVFKDYNRETGAIEWSMQRIGFSLYLDDRGLTSLKATDAFGNFNAASFTQLIEPMIQALKRTGVAASMISRRLNLYRIFFAEGDGLSVGIQKGKISGIMPINLGMTVRCVTSEEFANNDEATFFGSDDGYVYEMDVGRNLDGEEIEAFLRPAYHHSRSPSRQKHYSGATFEVISEGEATISIAPETDFGLVGQSPKEVMMQPGGGFWDVASWNEFVWSSGSASVPKMKLELDGTNISFYFYHKQANENPHTIHGVTVHWRPRRLVRG